MPTLFTKTLTNADSPFTISNYGGYSQVALLNDDASTANVTLAANGVMPNVSAAGSITLKAGKSWNWSTQSGALAGLTITIPSGATCYLTCGSN